MRPALRLHTICALLLALGALFGHICVLPGHAHAADHEHANTASDDHESAAAGLHAASCDMVRPSSPPPVAPAVVAARRAAVAILPARPALPACAVPEPTGSPPLYLAHHALLI